MSLKTTNESRPKESLVHVNKRYCAQCPHFDGMDWCEKYGAHVALDYYCLEKIEV